MPSVFVQRREVVLGIVLNRPAVPSAVGNGHSKGEVIAGGKALHDHLDRAELGRQ
ncbi:MAG TPA: hypothetical protein VHT52_12630 [Stellaceae bacterium]|jgi:hypothetical protein|nr:hypothetical protein [Stellaceae bacterium]